MNTETAEIINNFAQAGVLVIGDAILDVYHMGKAVKLNREAPVPVVRVSEMQVSAGGAANLAVNFARLGSVSRFISVIGDDKYGSTLKRVLTESGVDAGYLIPETDRETNSASRVMSEGHMLVRFDTGTPAPVTKESEWSVFERLSALYPKSDAVVISDYEKGFITANIMSFIAMLQEKYGKHVFVDAKNLKKYAFLKPYFVKPNFPETCKLIGIDPEDTGSDRVMEVQKRSEKILAVTKASVVSVTLDSDGSVILKNGRTPYRTYAKKVENSMAVGAGDTFTAAFTLATLSGADAYLSGEIASAACEIIVAKKGTATCELQELTDYFLKTNRKIVNSEGLADFLARERRLRRRIVFTNGCFDILHKGHVDCLNQAKALGDILIVGVNSDESVRRLKGPQRPINRLTDRMAVLSGLSSVDCVIPFEEDTPEKLIGLIKPDIFAKGGDYTVDKLPESAVVHSYGGRVEILPYLKDRSTTRLINRIRKQNGMRRYKYSYDR